MSIQDFSTEEIHAARILSGQDLYAFSRWMFLQRRGYPWLRGPHHQQICNALMRVYQGQCTRLIINVAPRYSKTELAVINFIAWALGNCPDAEFIHSSYSGRLAANNAWQTRELVQHPEYAEIFPSTKLRGDSSAKDEWRTTAGGCVYAVGAGGTITGYGAGKHREGFGGAIVLDDMHKADEARSDVVRQGVIEWFQNTLESRKNSPHTPIILIMQRLHEVDLAGWLLAGGNGEKWEHLCIKTLGDDGAALWPAKHNADMLRMMQQAAPYTFAGQYQQSPAPPEGNIFRPDMIQIVDAIPAGVTFIRAWDFAATENDGDWTVGGKLGKTQGGRFIIADIARFQGRPEEVEAGLINAAKRDGSSCRVRIPQDPGQAGKSQVSYFTRQLSGFTVVSKPISGDKVTRAEPFASQANVGNVMMIKAPWNDALISELRNFPNGKHDDQVDALADAFGELNDNSFGLLDYYSSQMQKKVDNEKTKV